MEKEELYLLIGSVFIKGYKKHLKNNSYKTALATAISKELKPVNTNKTISSKTLVNYFNYYCLNTGKEQNPDKDNLLILINYINNSSFLSYKEGYEHLKKNIFSKEYVNANIPYVDNKKSNESDKNPTENKSLGNIYNHNKTNASKQKNTSKTINLSETEIKTVNNSSMPFYVTMVIILAIVFGGFYFFNQKGDTNVNIDAVEINNDFRQIYPTKNTRFFDDSNTPLVWYAKNNQEIDYFNSSGNHPVTGKILEPITRELINTYFVEKVKIPTKEKLQSTKNTNLENKAKPYLLNISLKNNSNKEQISIFIVDEDYKLDTDATNALKNKLKEKKYSITIPLISSSKLNQEAVSNLQSINQDYFKDNLNSYTDYLCLGTATYNYSQNSIGKNLNTCELSINYSIISTKNGEEIDAFSKTISGTGSSKQYAKKNALYKLTL